MCPCLRVCVCVCVWRKAEKETQRDAFVCFLFYICCFQQAAVKSAASQAKVEQYEQDLARLKLKHQLELKV